MAHFSSRLDAHGGCLCKAIRYSIHIPTIDERPAAPGAAPTPVANSHGIVEDQVTRLPMIDLDHCTSCRLATGSIIQAWIVLPKSWVKWYMISKHENAPSAAAIKEDDYKEYTTGDLTENASAVNTATFYTEYISSPDTHRGFCGRCGTSLVFCYSGPKPNWQLPERNFDVSLGTLDREYLEEVHVDRHGWWNDGIGWMKALVRDGDNFNGARLVRHPTGAVKDVINEPEG